MFIGVMLVVIPIVFITPFLKQLFGKTSAANWHETLLFAASVAVGLTPGTLKPGRKLTAAEMLPMIVNANLSRGALAMHKEKCIVKRLESIINLGSIDVLCTGEAAYIAVSC